MGDMADFTNETNPDSFIDGADYYATYGGSSVPVSKTCRNCGESALQWMQHEGQWRLGKKEVGYNENRNTRNPPSRISNRTN